MPLRILVADGRPADRLATRALLELEGFEVVGEAADGHEAVRLAQALDPDVAILDASLPQLNGLDTACAMRQVCARTHVILMTVRSEERQIITALWVGIRGCVVKTEANADLVRAIEEVSRGGIFLSPSASHVVVDAYLSGIKRPPPPDRSPTKGPA